MSTIYRVQINVKSSAVSPSLALGVWPIANVIVSFCISHIRYADDTHCKFHSKFNSWLTPRSISDGFFACVSLVVPHKHPRDKSQQVQNYLHRNDVRVNTAATVSCFWFIHWTVFCLQNNWCKKLTSLNLVFFNEYNVNIQNHAWLKCRQWKLLSSLKFYW